MPRATQASLTLWMTAGLAVSAMAPVQAQEASAVTDPSDTYAWLEGVEDAKALEWVRGENAKTEAELAATPEFKKLEGDTVVLVQNGVYKPSDLCEWGGKLFAKAAGGYIRLRADGTTSRDGIRFEHMEFDGKLYEDKFGRLTISGGKPLEAPAFLALPSS